MSQWMQYAGRWTPDDRFGSPWQYLPVAVEPGCSGLRVELSYDRARGVLDLGCLGPEGFRGWSGGARSSFVITPREATPGYLSGELEAGQWQVMLGLYRIPPGGLEYEVTVVPTERFTPPAAVPPPVPQRPARRDLPAADSRRLADRDRGSRRAALHQPSHRRAGQLDLRDEPSAAAGRSVALELARLAMDDTAGLVAGMGSGSHSGRWQRLALATAIAAAVAAATALALAGDTYTKSVTTANARTGDVNSAATTLANAQRTTKDSGTNTPNSKQLKAIRVPRNAARPAWAHIPAQSLHHPKAVPTRVLAPVRVPAPVRPRPAGIRPRTRAAGAKALAATEAVRPP
jgi:hypothetical protein